MPHTLPSKDKNPLAEYVSFESDVVDSGLRGMMEDESSCCTVKYYSYKL